ncbi:Adhesion G protein-coupled receptor B2 [Plecturocebus cupreus]
MQLVPGPQAEGKQGCPHCATVAGPSWPLLSPCRHLRVPGEEPEEEPKVKTQWPRSADEPGLYMAQTGDPAAEEWSPWSVCSLTCGQGLQVRTRSCVSSPYGTLCSGPLRETRPCNNSATCPVHGVWEEWGSWSLCSRSCGRGSRSRMRTCVPPQHGGKACEGPELQTKLCSMAACPVEGQWLEWGPWGPCSTSCANGTQQRSRKCSVAGPAWATCTGALTDTRECSNLECPATDGKWGPWNAWSLCSKTCDTGWQRRFRMCQATGTQGYPCEGTGEEVKPCSEKRCPGTALMTLGGWGSHVWAQLSLIPAPTAFHEMCRDEYVMLMTWKKAAAGEIIYNKCPPNASGSASRRCLLSAQGVAYWGLPSFARCISHEYRYLYLSLREHLAKGQRMLAGEGMSQVVRSLQELLARRTYYSGDLLFSVDILRNVTDTFKRATYVPSADDVQRFFQVVSFMVDAENKEKWDDAQQVRGTAASFSSRDPPRLAPLHTLCPQVSPGSVHLLRVVEDFIHLVGDALKAFQSSLIVTDNLVISIQREPVSAVSSDITFPMRGRRGMKDWVRHSEDRLFLPKEVLSLSSPGKPATSGAAGSPGRGRGPGTVPPGPGHSHQRLLPADPDESSYFVIGAVLYRTLGLILPPPRPPLAVTSRVMTVTVRPPTQPPAEPLITVELSYIINGTTDPHCASWDYSRADASSGDWDTENCQTLETQAAHTRCQCQHLSTFAVLAQPPKDLTLELAGSPSVPLVIGCAVSCMALLTLLAIYAAFWRFIKSERSIILLNFCLSILASNILILVGQSRVLSKAGAGFQGCQGCEWGEGVESTHASTVHARHGPCPAVTWQVLTSIPLPASPVCVWAACPPASLDAECCVCVTRPMSCCVWVQEGGGAWQDSVGGGAQVGGRGSAQQRAWEARRLLPWRLLRATPSHSLSLQGVCTMTAAFLHFFFLSSFCWVLTEAWQSYLAVIGRMRTRLVRKRFLCLGWGLPALVVAVSVGFTRTKGYGTSSYCWLSLEGGLLYAFVGPAAVIVLVNMLIGIIVFNKLMARDGISDKSKKQRAGSERCPWASLLLPCSACGAVPSPLLSSASARNAMASLWSSCVVLPLLALTWMSAVLAMTDRRSVLFQALFAVFNSAQGFVITAVHCFLRREVQDVVKCQMGVCRADESEDSPDSCKNGQLQILSDFEKDVDLACQTVLFKEVNTCNPSTITGTLSRLSLDEDEEPKSCLVGPEGSLSFSPLPGNILVPMAASPGLGEPPPPQDANPVYMCGEGGLRQLDLTWLRPTEPGSEGDYMVLPRRTLSLQPGGGGGGGEDAPRTRPEGTPRRAAKTVAHTEGYPSFLSVDHSGLGLGPAYGSLQNPYGMTFQPPPTTPSARQVPEPGERSRTMPRTVPGSTMKMGSLERKKLRYSDLDFEKVMHTRKRHSELYHELNQKFHTFDRYRSQSTAKREKRWSVSSGGAAERSVCTDKPSPGERPSLSQHRRHQSWSTFKSMTLGSLPPKPRERLTLHRAAAWEPTEPPDGDFQTEV